VIHDRALLEELEKLSARPWEGAAFRHMFGSYPPDRENLRGARWNPPDIPAIYASISRETALAEAQFQIENQPLVPRARRVLYHLRIRLSSVLDLTVPGILPELGVTLDELRSPDHSMCRSVGGAVEWLGHDGLLVPSARADGVNLVIYPNRQGPGFQFESLRAEEIEPDRF